MSSPKPAEASRGAQRGGLPWLWLSCLVVVLDQLSKHLISSTLALHQQAPLLPGINLVLVHNPGAAFSFLSEASGWQRWFFIVITVFMVGALLLWLRSLRGPAHWLAAAIALIIGGALGNLADRVLYGYVVDFIDVYYQQWHWPAFNIADSAITIGATLLIVDLLLPNTAAAP